ncbi:MAG TPA: copper resistance protein CopC [Acidimicrobiales bacterium]|nr:copper resistance protein CopC [Acidimicrobiales bacterium]
MRRALLVCALALAALTGFAAPAAAHATLESSVPAGGARLDTPPRRVLLEFSERVEVALGGVRVFDSGGDRVDRGDLSHPNGRGSAVALTLPRLADGGYVVTWRVVSADSHPSQGAFSFVVGDAAPASAGEVAGLLGQRSGSSVVGVSYGVSRTVAFAGLLVLLGAVAFVVLVWPGARRDPRFRRVVVIALGLFTIATVTNLVLQTGYAAGLSVGDAVTFDAISDAGGTRFGRVYEVRLGLLVVAGPLVWILMRASPLPRWWRGVALLTGVAIAATPGLAGHAAVGSHQPWALAADVIHVCAAALWLGGLVMLVVTLPRVGDDDATAMAMAKCYSRLAFRAVVVLVATGLFQAYRQVGTVAALRTTEYGKFLAVKTLLVGTVLLVAWVSRRTVRHWGDGSVVALRRMVAVEAAIAIAVLSVTALLVNAPPAKLSAAAPQSGELRGAALLVDYTVSPGRAGRNDIHLYTLTRAGQQQAVEEMTLSLSLDDNGIASFEVPLVNAGPGHYQALDFDVPLPGRWKILLTARTSAIDSEVFEGTVAIR